MIMTRLRSGPMQLVWAAIACTAIVATCTGDTADEHAPATYTIAVDTVVDLGFGLPSNNPLLDAHAVRDAEGRYWVGPTTEPGHIAVFDRGGRYIASVGQRGAGPGEFQNIDKLFLIPGDTVAAADGLRVTVFNPDLTVSRTFPVNGKVLETARLGARIVLNTSNRTGPGRSIQIVDPLGRVERAFGSPRTKYDVFTTPRYFAVDDRGLWAARMNEYTVEQFDSTGQLIHRIHMTPHWFPRIDGSDEWTAAIRNGSVTRTVGLEEGPSGFLWFVSLQIETDPYRTKRPQSRDERVVYPSMRELSAFYKHRLDLLDTNTGDVAASVTLPPFGGFLDSTHVYTYDEAPDGNWYIRILQLTITEL